MNKQEFLKELTKALSALPKREQEERLSFYAEMIDDCVEEGVSEEEAVARIGKVDEVVARIAEEMPLFKIAKEHIKPNRKLKIWEVILLALGFPVWGSLLISALAVVVSLYISWWAIIISLWVAELSFVVSAVGAIALGPIYAVRRLEGAAVMIACGLVLAGFSILFFFVCKLATKGTLLLTKKMVSGMKRRFLRKEKEV